MQQLSLFDCLAGTREVPLAGGQIALVDTGDYDWLMGFRWQLSSYGYAKRNVRREDRRIVTIYMHREILKAPVGIQVDHINGNRLDNRQENLRLCDDASNNAQNRKKRQRKTSSVYKGVYWDSRVQRWGALIGVYGHRHRLGYFDDERQAALAYDKAAREFFGTFARPNLEG